ncbi:hypothetical protein BC567DRAFT_220041 [Phyllosticta citribraziliensis]
MSVAFGCLGKSLLLVDEVLCTGTFRVFLLAEEPTICVHDERRWRQDGPALESWSGKKAGIHLVEPFFFLLD